jgi:hypothetical protein
LQVFNGIFSNECLFPLESDEEFFDAEDGDFELKPSKDQQFPRRSSLIF